MKHITISDATLRDGSHAIRHAITEDMITQYCQQADIAGVDIVEVGHGNGLGASSLQLGLSKVDDRTMLRIARNALKQAKLGIHIIPGFGNVEYNLKMAIDEGIDVIRVASHCTEADTTQNHIKYSRKNNKIT